MINTKVPSRLNKDCPDCGIKLIEVRWAEVPEECRSPNRRNPMHMYPKLICEEGIDKTYHEYRFVCPECKKEWVYNSLSREFWEVPKNAQFYYSWEKELLIIRRPKSKYKTGASYRLRKGKLPERSKTLQANTPSKGENSKWVRISQADVATINNALAIISGYAQILARQAYIRPEDRKKLEEIVKQVERIAKLLPKARMRGGEER